MLSYRKINKLMLWLSLSKWVFICERQYRLKIWVWIPALRLNWLWLGRFFTFLKPSFFMGLLRENESAKFLIKFLEMLFMCELKLLHRWLKWKLWDVISSRCSETKSLMIQNYLVASGAVKMKLYNTTFSTMVVTNFLH